MNKISLFGYLTLSSGMMLAAQQQRQLEQEIKMKSDSIIQAPGGIIANNSQVDTLQAKLEKMLLMVKAISGNKFVDQGDKEKLEAEMLAAQQELQNLPVAQTIKGEIYLVRNPIMYYGMGLNWSMTPIYDLQGSKMTYQPQEVMVHVCMADNAQDYRDWDSWDRHGCPRFPQYLPLSFLCKKNEGDILTFLYKNTKEEFVKIELTCKQSDKGKYASCGDFAQTLRWLKNNFLKRASYASINDVNFLLEAHILEKNPEYKECNDYFTHQHTVACSEYLHGKNGFKS